MFFIFMISEILLARFLSHDLRSFLSIRSMGLGTTTSLIIYLQPWSESMALAPSIWQISPIPLNLDSSSLSKLGREICGFEKKNSLRTCFLCWSDTCVQVSSNLVPHTLFSGYVRPRPDTSSPRTDMSIEQFLQQYLMTALIVTC
jgi:hypothetical protein